MSVTRLSTSRNPVPQKGPLQGTWSRPTDWLALPTLTAGQERVVGLLFLHPSDSNRIALACAGAYTVDWGDGTVTNHATGVKAERNIPFANAAASTLTSDGHRQLIVSITPQSGSTLSSVDFGALFTGTTAGTTYQWRDVAVVGSGITNLVVSNSSSVARSALRWFTFVGSSMITNMQDRFYGAIYLRGITGTTWSSGVTTFYRCFVQCYAMETVPVLDTSACIDFTSMFESCYALRTAPFINTAAGTNFTGMFSVCPALTSVPLFNTAAGTNFTNMFNGCSSLPSIPLFNTALGTNFSTMLNACVNLTSVPLLNTGNAANITSMLANCQRLAAIPAFDFSKVVTATNLFQGCWSLRGPITLDLPAATAINSIVQDCFSLEGITLTNTTLVVNATNLAYGTRALRTLSVNLTGIANVSQIGALHAAGTVSLNSVILTGLKYAPPSFAGQALSAAAMNDLYTSLGTAAGAQTLTVSSNPGSGASTPSIATAKGWTVTGG